MKLIVLSLVVALVSMFAGCASTTTRPAAIAPGALSSPDSCTQACPDGAECRTTCEELPDGNCLVTCYVDGEVVCRQVCTPVECDGGDCPAECRVDCSTACPGGGS